MDCLASKSKSKPTAGFLDLPEEIIYEIITWLTKRVVNTRGKADPAIEGNDTPDYVFVPNLVRIGEYYKDALLLSSTCSYLRVLLGPFLFESTSLVRKNQLDAVLCNPKPLEVYSDSKRYHREYFKEILGTNFSECSKADLARDSFKIAVNGDESFQSKFQKLVSMNNFVEYLECNNASLKNHDLSYFPKLRNLKILDSGLCDTNEEIFLLSNIPNLKYLAVTATALKHSSVNSCVPRLKRLDLLCDFNELNPGCDIKEITASFNQVSCDLQELNVFVNLTYALTYSEVLELVQTVVKQCKELKSITFRLTRRRGVSLEQGTAWKIFDSGSNGAYFIDTLNLCQKLRFFSVDLQLLEAMDYLNILDLNYQVREARTSSHSTRLNKISFTLIDPSLSTPKFVVRSRNIVSYVVQALQVGDLHFHYGEVVEQCHLQSLNVVTNFVEFLSIPHGSSSLYDGISRISTEKCWSVSDDTCRREHYHKLLLELGDKHITRERRAQIQQKISSCFAWTRISYNSPRYRIKEFFDVHYALMPLLNYFQLFSEHNLVRELNLTEIPELQLEVTIPSIKLSATPAKEPIYSTFWSVESSLVDMEQYSLKQKKLSRIWYD